MHTPDLQVAVIALLVGLTAYALYLISSLLRRMEDTPTRRRNPRKTAPARPGGALPPVLPRRKVVAAPSLRRIDPDVHIVPYVVISINVPMPDIPLVVHLNLEKTLNCPRSMKHRLPVLVRARVPSRWPQRSHLFIVVTIASISMRLSLSTCPLPYLGPSDRLLLLRSFKRPRIWHSLPAREPLSRPRRTSLVPPL